MQVNIVELHVNLILVSHYHRVCIFYFIDVYI